MVPPCLPTASFHGKSTLCMRESCTSLEKLSKPGPFLARRATGTAAGLLALPVQSCFSSQGCRPWEAAAFPAVRPGISSPVLGAY